MLVVWIAMCESTLNVANPAIPLMGFTETKINNRTRKQLHSSLRAFSLVWSFTRTRVECHSHSRGVSLALARSITRTRMHMRRCIKSVP